MKAPNAPERQQVNERDGGRVENDSAVLMMYRHLAK